MTHAEHEKKLKSPAVCELLPLRDLPNGGNVMVRTNGAFVAGYELRGKGAAGLCLEGIEGLRRELMVTQA